MAKRFTDTNKYKKPFIRSLPGAYKLLWDFLYHDCDHAGIWIVDFEIAQSYVGRDMPITQKSALLLFNEDEHRIIELDGGKRWFIPSFIEFQYGKLSEKNRAHINVINILKKFDLLTDDLLIKPITSPLQGVKEKEKEMEQETEDDFGKCENLLEIPLDAKTLEAAEMNQFQFTKNRNTDFVKAQFEIFKRERVHDPPVKQKEYIKYNARMYSHFLNWIRNKFPKHETNLKPVTGNKQRGAYELLEKTRAEHEQRRAAGNAG